ALDEGIDHRGLHVVAELLARRDRRLELVPQHDVIAHALIVWTGRARGNPHVGRARCAAAAILLPSGHAPIVMLGRWPPAATRAPRARTSSRRRPTGRLARALLRTTQEVPR